MPFTVTGRHGPRLTTSHDSRRVSRSVQGRSRRPYSQGRSRPLPFNTEKLELPSLSKVHTRGAADVPWYPHHLQRPLLSGDRLPELQLPQSYTSSSSFGLNSVRVGGADQPSGGDGNQYLATHAGCYSNNQTDIGLKTPSPSPTSSGAAHPGASLSDPEPSGYTQQHSQIQPYPTPAEQYTTAMNHQQQQYMDSQQSQMSAGQSYAPQSTTAGGLTHYPQYQQAQPPVLQPAPSSYSHSPGPYGQHYSFGNGMTSPHGTGQPVSASMASHMNPGLPPLPSKYPHVDTNHTRADAEKQWQQAHLGTLMSEHPPGPRRVISTKLLIRPVKLRRQA